MEIRVGGLEIAREREVLVLANLEGIELEGARFRVEPVLGLVLRKEGVIDSDSILVVVRGIEDLVQIHFSL